MEVHVIGIDLGKTVFHLVGVDAEAIAEAVQRPTMRFHEPTDLQYRRAG
jgi:hypothetical protein